MSDSPNVEQEPTVLTSEQRQAAENELIVMGGHSLLPQILAQLDSRGRPEQITPGTTAFTVDI